MSSSVSIDSNKRETMHLNVCQLNASVLNTKIVNAVNDGLNIVCVSYGKDVFFLSHEKCVARYALSRDSTVKRALYTTPIAAKSKNLGAISVVAKSRLSVAKTSTATNKVIQLVLWIVDSGCSMHMTGNLSLLRNFIEKFIGTVRFRNDHFTAITGYEDYVQGYLTICRVYYVEGLGHNLFLVRQFYDGDLELAASSPVCLMSKATSTKLWPMRVASINGKKYILVIVDDYSRYTWVYFLRTKDKALDMIIDFINQVQQNLKVQILKIQTDNGTEFKNEKLRSFYAKLGIVHNTSIARTPQQNGVVEHRNHTLVEAAHTMLIFSKSLEFLWAEAIATAWFTQNRSIIHTSLMNSQQWLLNATIHNPDSTAQILKIHQKIHNQYHRKQSWIICLVYCMKKATSPLELSNNFAAHTLDNNNTSSSSSIVVEEDEAPQIVSSSTEQVTNESNTLVLNDNINEFVQKDVAELDENVFYIQP
ncbi:retrovirus-related pol polyprotein from transposon TNT 1-94 [Tanacetum coccineum]|uniref:Retrovirus-related pol polyprotein from transposon TNT 1-94 n=1 Tax=Tanacetum coccineum TaxID=301880 RepID=A0ABQ5AAS6_9ASTR